MYLNVRPVGADVSYVSSRNLSESHIARQSSAGVVVVPTAHLTGEARSKTIRMVFPRLRNNTFKTWFFNMGVDLCMIIRTDFSQRGDISKTEENWSITWKIPPKGVIFSDFIAIFAMSSGFLFAFYLHHLVKWKIWHDKILSNFLLLRML